MKIIRYKKSNTPQLGVVTSDEKIYDLPYVSLQEVDEEANKENKSLLNFIQEKIVNLNPSSEKLDDLELLVPIEVKEVWAAGVTYQTSRSARNYETTEETSSKTFYDKVYDAKRPELFLKSTIFRTCGPNDVLNLRTDSNWQVPEPELGVVINREGNIIGYLIGNDMSCRDIEGENPLYLPQAKVWKNSCSIGPAILLAEAVEDPYNFDIICRIKRNGENVFEQSANTSQLKRKFDELVYYLLLGNDIFDGTVLLTGTSIVPPNDFTLETDDIIEIEVPGIGTLKNKVEKVS